jgi:lysozyme
MTDYVLGIDLSRYRDGVPLKTAKQQGVRFLICKATEGTDYIDHTYKPYQAEAKSIGMYYCEQLGEVQFPPIVDVERINNTKPGTRLPIVSIQSNRNHLKIVLNVIEEKTGLKPMIYTNHATWQEQFGNWDLIKEHEVWVANWRLGHSPYLPEPATEWHLHQYTSIYKIEGYYRGVDGNWFNGNEGEFEQQLVEWDSLWNPAPPPSEKEQFVTLEVTKDNHTNLFILTTGDSVVMKVEEF